MEAIEAALLILGLMLYGWLWYGCVILADRKRFPFWGVSAMCLLTTPLVVYIALLFMPDRAQGSDRKLTTAELTAVFEAKAARLEAERNKG